MYNHENIAAIETIIELKRKHKCSMLDAIVMYCENLDIDLDEFSDEIETWIIDEFKRVGCDTARSILNLSAEELEKRTDLEKETIADVRRILQEEFDKGE